MRWKHRKKENVNNITSWNSRKRCISEARSSSDVKG